jgi:O-acetyl-ADP-ribose deacetylase (regulator of RNase III)
MKKLIHKNGNLLTSTDVEVIAHQCNCQNTFGAGIAKNIKEMYPKAYHADTMAYKDGKAVLGSYSFCHLDGPIKKIFNLYGQNLNGKAKRKTNYDALYTALEGMRNYLTDNDEDLPVPNIGLPYLMGCGLGGGDWRIVERLIEVAFHNYNGEVIIYKFYEADKVGVGIGGSAVGEGVGVGVQGGGSITTGGLIKSFIF